MTTRYTRLPHGWRHLNTETLRAISGLCDNDSDLVDIEVASRVETARELLGEVAL